MGFWYGLELVRRAQRRSRQREHLDSHEELRATGERVDGWTVTAPEAPTTIPSRLPTRCVVCAAWRPGHPGGGRPSAPTSLHPLREAARDPHACRDRASARRCRPRGVGIDVVGLDAYAAAGWPPALPATGQRLECPIQGLAPSRAAAAMLSPPPTEAWSPSSPSSRSP